jgi:predicted nucleotidyltransferase
MLAMPSAGAYHGPVSSPQAAGGKARARALGAERRSAIARAAAVARWKASPRATLRMSELRDLAASVRQAASAKATVYLFGSYARDEAGPGSDVDLLVVEQGLSDWVMETVRLRRVARAHIDKEVDLVVMGASEFRKWRGTAGTVQHVVATEGIRLAG